MLSNAPSSSETPRDAKRTLCEACPGGHSRKFATVMVESKWVPGDWSAYCDECAAIEAPGYTLTPLVAADAR